MDLGMEAFWAFILGAALQEIVLINCGYTWMHNSSPTLLSQIDIYVLWQMCDCSRERECVRPKYFKLNRYWIWEEIFKMEVQNG